MAYPIVKYMLEKNKHVRLKTQHPYIFQYLARDFGGDNSRLTFGNVDFDRLPNIYYGNYRTKVGTTQFQDSYFDLGIKEDLEFKIDIPIKIPFHKLDYRPLVVVKAPCHPGRWLQPQEQRLILPDYKTYNRVVESLRPKCYTVLVGANNHHVASMPRTDLDLSQAYGTDWEVLLGVVAASDLVVCPQGHMIIISEGLNKKVLVYYSSLGLTCNLPSVNSINPKKMFTKSTSNYATDSETFDELRFKILSML